MSSVLVFGTRDGNGAVTRAAAAVETLAAEGLERAQARFN
jgi:hypothetical protein